MKKENKRKHQLRIKTISVMKLTALFLVGFCLHLSAATYAQKITLSEQNASLSSIFKQIEKQSGYTFAYTVSMMEEAKPVSVNLLNVTLEEALEQCFKNQPFTYTIIENTVVLKPLSDIKISGKVTDEDGLPLPGSTVLIKGTYKGITTDKEGNYAIKVSGPETILVFSFVGFKSQEITVGVQTSIDVTMEQATTELDEVFINAGYYKTPEKLVTGSISHISAKEIEQQPVSNPIQALQGRMPGVNIQQTTGVPGGGFTIEIRGKNSLRDGVYDNGNLPLYLVDGVPFPTSTLSRSLDSPILTVNASPLSSINPNDIESIEILKDADATAIYGSRGANGVVLITTKKGQAGKTRVTINASTGFGKVSSKIDLLNTAQYLEMRKEAFANDGATPNQFNAPDLLLWDQDRETDWQEVLLGGTAKVTNIQASVSGGTANTQFLLSSTYYRETTVFPGDFSFQRPSALLNINHVSQNQRFRIGASVAYSAINNNLPSADFAGVAVSLAPNAPAIYDEEGELNWENGSWFNPLAGTKRTFKKNVDNLVASANVEYELYKGLNLKTQFSYTKTDSRVVNLVPISSLSPFFSSRARRGSIGINDGFNESWIFEPQMNYLGKLGKANLTLLLGVTLQGTLNQNQWLYGRKYTSDLLLENIQAAPELMIRNNEFYEYRYNAVFGRLNYNLNNELIINFTARRDGSSRFGPNKRFGNFGAVGAAWIFTERPYFTNSFLSFGKIRTSYGITGSDQTPNYGYLSSYSALSYPYAGTSVIEVSRLPNNDFSWESNKKFELTMELGFFNDRIFFTGSWYKNRSSNQLVGFPLPAITGDNSVQVNLPATVQNTGLEFLLNTTNIKSRDFEWRSSVNISFPRNKLIRYDNLENSPYSHRYKEGESLYIQPSYQYTGVDPETGIYTFIDVDEDGDFRRPHDILTYPEIAVDYFGGIHNSISYKNFQLDFLIDFRKQTGRNYLLQFPRAGSYSSWSGSNQPTIVLNRWQKPGDVTDIQQFTQTFGAATFAYFDSYSGSNRIVDASYISLRNISLSYTVPKKIAQRLNIHHLRLYVQGQNLFNINNSVINPETNNAKTLPPLRMITAGIEMTF